MGIFRKKQQPFDSVGHAQVLMSHFVEKPDDYYLRPFVVAIPSEMKFWYHSKTHLYRLAVVLTALLAKEQEHPIILEIRKSFEKLVFNLPQEDGMAFFEKVMEAGRSFNDLLIYLRDQNHGMIVSWARSWLQDVGVNEENIIVSSAFAKSWTGSYIVVLETIRDITGKFRG